MKTLMPQLDTRRKFRALQRTRTAPDALDVLVADVRTVAREVFLDRADARRIAAAMQVCAGELRRLPEAQPQHEQWSRVAIIVQLLITSVEPGRFPRAALNALERLTGFIQENDDLLTLEAPL